MDIRNSGLSVKKNHSREEVNLMKGYRTLLIVVAAMALLVSCAYAVPVTTEQQFTTIHNYYDPVYGVPISGTQVFNSITDTTDGGITTRSTFVQTTYMQDLGGQLVAKNSEGTSETKNMATGAVLASGKTYRNYAYNRGVLSGCTSNSKGDQYKETSDGRIQTAHYETTDTNKISFGMVDTYYSYTETTSMGPDGSGGVQNTDFTTTSKYSTNVWRAGQFINLETTTNSRTDSLLGNGSWSVTDRTETFNFDEYGKLVQDAAGNYSNIVLTGNQQSFDSGVLQPEQKVVSYTYKQALGAHGVVTYEDETKWGPV